MSDKRDEQPAGVVRVGEPMGWIPPKGAGATLETIGYLMICVSIIGGLMALFAFGKVTSVEKSFYGPQVATKWAVMNVLLILGSTFWSVCLSFAVTRLGTALQWLEVLGEKQGIDSR